MLNSQQEQEIHLFSKSSNPFSGYLVLFCQEKGSWGMMQTTHLHLAPLLRTSVVVPGTPHIPSWHNFNEPSKNNLVCKRTPKIYNSGCLKFSYVRISLKSNNSCYLLFSYLRSSLVHWTGYGMNDQHLTNMQRKTEWHCISNQISQCILLQASFSFIHYSPILISLSVK